METSPIGPKRWTEEETILALFLYFQLPFGKLHSGNPEIRSLAGALGRTNSSVAMKLCNFASLDPKITGSGRKGLDGASKLDRSIYSRFAHGWSQFAEQGERLWLSKVERTVVPAVAPTLHDSVRDFHFEPFRGEASETEAIVAQRLGQGFFRRAVLANYDDSCCITGIAEPRLLVASHIRPWKIDEHNRHNPANGLLLSATMDKAFDQGLITVTSDRIVKVSKQLASHPNDATRAYFAEVGGKPIQRAARFEADPAFLDWHHRHRFLDNRYG